MARTVNDGLIASLPFTKSDDFSRMHRAAPAESPTLRTRIHAFASGAGAANPSVHRDMASTKATPEGLLS